MPDAKSSEQKPLPTSIIDFVTAFMRALNTARLYASGHDIFKKHTQQLYTKLHEAIADNDFLFLGCAKDFFFLEGTFYQAKDAQLQKFLKFFHSLRISHMLLDKEITAEELESFIGLLAGAQQGQGEEVSSALPRENIKRVKLGLLDYSIFSTVQTVATQLAQTIEDEAIWGQLILHPVAAGTFSLSPDKIKQLTSICEDVEELKKLLLQMDTDMAKRQKGVSITQRGILLGNFIQNLGDTLEGVAPEEKNQFTRQVSTVLDSLEPQLKTQILGAVAPDTTKEEGNGVIHEIFQEMPDSQLVYLLVDALKEAGANSRCFNNLFNRALTKYKEPGLLLTLIRQEMHRATEEGESKTLSHWQHLEQLLIQQHETDELNKQYHKEIEALATSIQMQAPMVEEEEMGRLLKTLSPEPLRASKAQMIVNLISQPHTTQTAIFLPSLVESLGEIPLKILIYRRSTDPDPYIHAINVSALSMALAQQLGLEDSIIQEVGLAALLHDIGIHLSPSVSFTKTAAINLNEKKRQWEHPIRGAEILLATPGMPDLVPIVAYKHHLHYDGGGYPEQERPRELNLVSMIICITDSYDNLRRNRPEQDALSLTDTLNWMDRQVGTYFHPLLFKQFRALVKAQAKEEL